MGVNAETGLLIGSLIFVGAAFVIAIFLAFYVRQKTKDVTMRNDNAK
jgi:hypothetical protein